MKTLIKLGIAAAIVLFLVFFVVNYFKSQPDLMAFFEDIYEGADNLEEVLKNTFDGIKGVCEYIGGELKGE